MKKLLPILIFLSPLPLFVSAQTNLVDTDFTEPLGDDVFGYAWAANEAGMLWNEGNQQVITEGGRVEFSFDSTAAGGWFGGAVGVYRFIEAIPENLHLSDLSLSVDLSVLGGLDAGRGSVRIQIDLEDSTRPEASGATFLKIRSDELMVGEGVESITFPDLSEFEFVPDDTIGLTLEVMEAAATQPLPLDGLIVWLEVGDGATHFGNTAGNSIRLHQMVLSTPLSLPDPEPPAAPSNLSATAVGQNRIDLTWTDNSSDETGFRIEQSTDAGASFNLLANVAPDTTSHSHTGLAAASTVTYRVRAESDAGVSDWSNVATATTDSVTDPEPDPEPVDASHYPFAMDDFATDQTSGFVWTWLGWVWLDFDIHPFIHSFEIGWLAFSGTAEELFLYHMEEAWLFTSKDIFPFAYGYAEEAWFYFEDGMLFPL
ncbi:MAG: fibronectin type III domain-containing protein [Opitutales bacterium]|nr:fibronectin type III domain-containing protein [Opitutales bacterium]